MNYKNINIKKLCIYTKDTRYNYEVKIPSINEETYKNTMSGLNMLKITHTNSKCVY